MMIKYLPISLKREINVYNSLALATTKDNKDEAFWVVQSEVESQLKAAYILGVMDGIEHLLKDLPPNLEGKDKTLAIRWLAQRLWDDKRSKEDL